VLYGLPEGPLTETTTMKRVLLLAASALVLMAFVPEPADAQGRRFGVRGGVVRGPVYAYPRGYYGYRRGYRPGVGAAIGLGLGAAALGAAVAAPYYGYGYGGDPCLRQQQVVDAWGYARWTYVRVC
jgi:hypothetical protein